METTDTVCSLSGFGCAAPAAARVEPASSDAGTATPARPPGRQVLVEAAMDSLARQRRASRQALERPAGSGEIVDARSARR